MAAARSARVHASARRIRTARFCRLFVLAILLFPLARAGVASAAQAPEFGLIHEIPDLRLTLQPIPPGEFVMGDAASRFSDERPLTRVRITRPFWLGKTEVTQAQWQSIMGGNPSHFRDDERPVETVGWKDAMDFCRKLTEREREAGRLPEGYHYSLPTEAQWEYACRGGGAETPANQIGEYAWHSGNSQGTTHPVGKKRANAWGLHDMLGNVGEWCADYYGDYPGGSVVDPKGVPPSSNHVYRGGGWGDDPYYCRAECRNGLGVHFFEMTLGFRVALRPEASGAGDPGGPLARKGKLLLSDDFSRNNLGPDWYMLIPTYAVTDGTLLGRQTAEWHGSVALLKIDTTNCILELRFRFEGADGFNVVWGDRSYRGSHAGHICRATVTPKTVGLGDDRDGIMRNDVFLLRRDPNARAASEELLVGRSAKAEVSLEPRRWYRMKVELLGARLRLWLDGREIVALESSGIAHERKRTILFTALGDAVRFDDVRLWEALPAEAY